MWFGCGLDRGIVGESSGSRKEALCTLEQHAAQNRIQYSAQWCVCVYTPNCGTETRAQDAEITRVLIHQPRYGSATHAYMHICGARMQMIQVKLGTLGLEHCLHGARS